MREQPDPWLVVSPKQFKEGWIEMRGVTPVHHDFMWVRDIDAEHIVVRNPQWVAAQRPLEPKAFPRR